jgi:tRNA modification GTPase
MLAGRPNVGKSSLINALAGYQRAIVHPRAGTTRDVLSFDTAIDGWPVELSDTAGFRASDDPLETAGVEMAQAELGRADLVVLIFDAISPPSEENEQLLTQFPGAITVLNKIDLEPDRSCGKAFDLHTSAATGVGVDRLLAAISDWICPDLPSVGSAVPFRPWHVERLTDLWTAIRRTDENAARKAIGTLEVAPEPPRGKPARP